MTTSLPPDVRALVVGFAAEALADLPDNEVPASLAAVRRFIKQRRARQGAAPLAAAVENDPVFRSHVAEKMRQAHQDLVAAITSAEGPPPAAPPEEVAAVAYILRPPNWEHIVDEAVDACATSAAVARAEEADKTIERLEAQLETLRRNAQSDIDHLRDQLAATRVEIEDTRRKLRSSGERVRRAEVAEQAATDRAHAAEEAARTSAREADAEARRIRGRIAELEEALAAARRGGKQARSVDDARLRVLLDGMMSAANGIRRELALPPGVVRPADLGREGSDGELDYDPFAGIEARGRADDDPTLIDEILTVPGVHVIVDGYNVTKRGYGSLTLHAQRARLLSGLSALAGRVPELEMTVVFDATAVVARPVGVATPRGVRVVFSKAGQLADEEIVRLVRKEPPGRPIAVITSDREVADLCTASGARHFPSAALLARLER
jgi:predicted RNA-binding protein with PIN domain